MAFCLASTPAEERSKQQTLGKRKPGPEHYSDTERMKIFLIRDPRHHAACDTGEEPGRAIAQDLLCAASNILGREVRGAFAQMP